MTLKEGDMVRIKPDLTECDHDDGECYMNDEAICPWVNEEMVYLAGKIVTISTLLSSGRVALEDEGYQWCKEFFETVEKMKEKGKYKIIMTRDKEELVMVT